MRVPHRENQRLGRMLRDVNKKRTTGGSSPRHRQHHREAPKPQAIPNKSRQHYIATVAIMAPSWPPGGGGCKKLQATYLQEIILRLQHQRRRQERQPNLAIERDEATLAGGGLDRKFECTA